MYHERRYNLATKEFSEINLVYHEAYLNRRLAEKREKQLKGWTKAKKKALIEGNTELLKILSKNRGHVDGYSRE